MKLSSLIRTALGAGLALALSGASPLLAQDAARTALTLTSGITRQPRRWFAGWIAIAALVWASYAALLGAVAKDRFKENHTMAFVAAFGAAVGITLLIELVRHVRGRGQDSTPRGEEAEQDQSEPDHAHVAE